MEEDRPIPRPFLLHGGRILLAALAAGALAATISLFLPREWESRAVLLPPERRAADFRYTERSLRGLRALVWERDLHPLDVWEALLESPGTADRVVSRLDLERRWKTRSREEARERVLESLSFRDVPYRGFEVIARARDPSLAADLANTATKVLDERLRELYRDDVEAEREFLRESLLSEVEAGARREADVARARASSGVADERAQSAAARELAADLATSIARARTARSEAARRHGKGSAAERDWEQRVLAMERALQALPLAVPSPGSRAAERDLLEIRSQAQLFSRLSTRTVVHQASHDLGVRVLDPAVPPERPERSVALPAAAAALLVPGCFGAGALLRRAHRALPSGASPRLDAARRRGEAIGARVLGSTAGATLLAAACAASGVAFSVVPAALAAVLSAVFLIVLAIDLRWAWLALLIALPWAVDYVNVQAGFALQFPTEPGIFLLLVAWAYVRALRPRPIVMDPLLASLVLLVLWMAVASITSVHPRHSAFQVVSVGGLILAGAIFPMLEFRRAEEVERALHVVLASAAVAAAIGIAQVVLSPLPFGRATFHIGEGFLYNHGPYAAYLGFAMGPAFVFLLGARWTFRSLPLLSACALLTLAMVVSLSRAGWLSALVLVLALAAFRARLFLRRAALPVALAALALGVGFVRAPDALGGLEHYWRVSTSADYRSNVDRIERFVAAWRMFRDRPLLGVGPGAYESAYEDYRSFEFASGPLGAHSEILRQASEQGLPGVVFLLVVVLLFYRTGLRLVLDESADPRLRKLAAALLAGMLTYTVHSLVNEYWRVPKIAWTMWIFVGLLGAVSRMSRAGPFPRTT